MLRRSPWFAVTSIGTVAVALALAATVFAVVDGVLFKPLPYKDPDRLVLLFRAVTDPVKLARIQQGTGRSGVFFSSADLNAWRENSAGLSIAAFVTNFGVGPVIGDNVTAETTWAARIGPAFFDVLGVQPLFGGFREEHYSRPFEFGKLSAQPAIISYRLWQRLGGVYGGMPHGLLRVGDGTLDVVGVLPPDFIFPMAFARTTPDVLFPLRVLPDEESLSGVVRLPSGVPIAQARAQLEDAALEPVAAALGARERPVFRMTLAAVFAVVLLAALNVAVLMGARRRDRARELAVRTALGASTSQLIQLMLAEAIVIAVAGACLGVMAAKPMLEFVSRLLPTGYLLIKAPVIDLRVLTFAIVIAISTVLGFACWPVLRAAGADPSTDLKQREAARVRILARRGALAVQSAIGMLVVVAGTLLLVGFATIWNEDPGLDRSRTAVVGVTARAISGTEERTRLLDQSMQVAARVPRIVEVSAVSGPFLDSAISGSAFTTPPGALEVMAQDVPIAARFFQSAGIRLLAGRFPTEREIESASPVAVVSDDLARAFWPGREALGQLLTSRRGAVSVIGIVSDVRVAGLEERWRTAEIYVPMAFAGPERDRVLFLRTSSEDADDAADRVAGAIRQALPQLAITRAESIDAALAKTVRPRQLNAVLFGTFAGATLLLLGVGMFGAVAMNTAARSREIGVRMALGASPGRVRRMVIGENLIPVSAGLVAGAALAWWTTTFLASLIYGIGPHEPELWATAAGFVLTTALAATWFPAARASRIDPFIVLKTE
jgi:putative ABC transport system permease protein